ATSEQRPALAGLAVMIGELGSARDPAEIAARLYAALRELDGAELDIILAADLPYTDGLWEALRDRLRRAAAHVVSP
ncbi:MAG: Sua5 family C-terminal domain-containing protein, partial [Gammaproteobacteria bacterium]